MNISKQRINQILFILILIVAIIAGWATSELFKNHKDENNIEINFSLLDQFGKSVTEKDYKKSNKIFFFGFTHCPDVCPIGVNLLSNVIDNFHAKNIYTKKLKFIFITVDPKRDTPEQMKEFLSNFNNEIIGLTGTYDDLLPVWKNFFVHVKNETNSEHHNHLDIDNNHKHSDEEEPSSEDYIVQHSAFYFIFDINNKLKTILPFGSSIEEVEKELKDLL